MVVLVDEEVFGVELFVGVEKKGDFGGLWVFVDKVVVEEILVFVVGSVVYLEEFYKIKVLICIWLVFVFLIWY